MSEIIADIEAFLDRTGMSATAFGSKAVKDPRLVHDLKNKGRRLWPETEERVRAFMEEATKQ